ncbi:MAG: Rrf2 family transcriptional regulator [Halomonas sp.]|uniref:Rrf2 family transcriptional regulator n=1 Tax=Halomonas sp. TaxID=1486246 RepID=UPI003F909D41
MRLTTRGRYAVTAMLDLVMNHESRPVSLADISQRQQISLSYLEQLFARLRRGGLVNSVRGPGGGYLPAMSADDISVASIIDAVDESVDSTRCGGLSDCQQGDTCLTHHLWSELSEEIHCYLTGVSLGSLARREEIQQIALRQHHTMDDKRIPVSSP